MPRGIFQVINDFFSILDVSGFDPVTHYFSEVLVEMAEILEDNESLHLEPFAQNHRHQPVHPVWALR